MDFDPGPPPALAAIFATLPDHRPFGRFRMEWGPKFYRGRTDGSARVLVIGQDAASEEDIARRNFVGNAGRKVQGFLAKCGITRSYIMINAFTYSVYGQFDAGLEAVAEDPAMLDYRNAVFDWVRDNNNLEAIIAFGRAAAHAVEVWSDVPTGVYIARPRHPSARPASFLLASWRHWIPQLRARVTADPDGDQTAPNYKTDRFRSNERPPIPRIDLPFGMPAWFGQKNLKTTTRRSTRVIEWKAPSNSTG
jgi:hypothetical protein